MSRRQEDNPIVGVIMGSRNDLNVMSHASLTLEQFGVPHETRIISAHRTPDKMVKYGKEAVKRGLKVIVAGAGGSAHLPGEISAHTRIPVLGVAIESSPDPLMSAIGSQVRMPEGVPIAFMGINKAGAVNAGLEAVRILGLLDERYAEAYEEHMEAMRAKVESEDAVLRSDGLEVFLRDSRYAEEIHQTG